ncbi:6991_t:CDS:1 [Entrophospora sp. SA101]|nr:6991_t:CDS:1 [Entrophospora sp. SA101]CAJ0900475.1 1516_t:CDS:1 [Entrophospora sp. SA101]
MPQINQVNNGNNNISNHLRRDLGRWLRQRIYPLAEEKTLDAYNYYLHLINNHNNNEKYNYVSHHQFLVYVARSCLQTDENSFPDIHRSLLALVVSDLNRSSSDYERYKVTIYTRRFNEFIDRRNSANQDCYNQLNINDEDDYDQQDKFTWEDIYAP